MEPILSKCGYRCDLCLAYKPNLEKHPENSQILSDGWHTYFGFRIPPENIHCDGCHSNEGRQIDSSCPVRPCVIARKIDNCAYCDDYICERLETRMVSFQEIQDKFDEPITAIDRTRFIAPYENRNRLGNLRLKN
jgi:hypothetical protein